MAARQIAAAVINGLIARQNLVNSSAVIARNIELQELLEAQFGHWLHPVSFVSLFGGPQPLDNLAHQQREHSSPLPNLGGFPTNNPLQVGAETDPQGIRRLLKSLFVSRTNLRPDHNHRFLARSLAEGH